MATFRRTLATNSSTGSPLVSPPMDGTRRQRWRSRIRPSRAVLLPPELGSTSRPRTPALPCSGIDPLSNATEHQRQFRAYVAEHRAVILNGLRDRFVTRVHESEEARSRYAELLGSPSATVDPTWERKYCARPRVCHGRTIAVRLDEAAGPLEEHPHLPPVTDLREKQKRSLATVLSRARDNVFDWCALHEVDGPTPIDVQVVGARIREGGYQDFRELQRDEVLALLVDWGFWPNNMPVSLNQKELGITAEDQRKFREQRAKAREAERKRAASVTVGNVTSRLIPTTC